MNAATKLPLELGPIHFVGIGGSGGLAGVVVAVVGAGAASPAPSSLPSMNSSLRVGSR